MELIARSQVAPLLAAIPTKSARPASLALNTLYRADYYIYGPNLVLRIEWQYVYAVFCVIHNNVIISRIVINMNGELTDVIYENGQYVINSHSKTAIVNYGEMTINEVVKVYEEPPRPPTPELEPEEKKITYTPTPLGELELDFSDLL